MLRVTQLRKSYGDVEALADVSFSVERARSCAWSARRGAARRRS
jgi:ABC-type Na+ transport system ATPase subunit NatA